jgi:hypothetical protein
MILDTVELQQHVWLPRRHSTTSQTLAQIKVEANEDN